MNPKQMEGTNKDKRIGIVESIRKDKVGSQKNLIRSIKPLARLRGGGEEIGIINNKKETQQKQTCLKDNINNLKPTNFKNFNISETGLNL